MPVINTKFKMFIFTYLTNKTNVFKKVFRE